MKRLKKTNIEQEGFNCSPVPTDKCPPQGPFFNTDYFGHVVVQTIEELNSIPCKLRQDGMVASIVQDEYSEWQLQSSKTGFGVCDNRAWVKIVKGEAQYDGGNLFLFDTEADANNYIDTTLDAKQGQMFYIAELDNYYKFDGQDVYTDPFPNKLDSPTEQGTDESLNYKIPTYVNGKPYWRNSTEFGKVKSVNGKTGDVVLKTSDLENDSDYTTTTALNFHVNNKNNPHNVTKEQLNLGNVDNTSDLNKPISTATQTELNKKINKPTINNTPDYVLLADGSTAPKNEFGNVKTVNGKSPDSTGNTDIGIDDTLRVNNITERIIEFEDGGITLDVIDEEGLEDKKFFAYSVREEGKFRIGTGCGSSKGGWSAATFFGWGSLIKLNRNNTTTKSTELSAYGYNSLKSFEGGDNGGITSIGANTLFKFVGTNDPQPAYSYFMTALGINALYDFLDGSRNTALGGSSGRRLVTGSYNTFTGSASMQELKEGSNNTAIGCQVTSKLKKGSNNTFIGANLQLNEEEVNDTVIIADGTGKQHFKSDDKGSILPSQTIALIDADETGKAVTTKEFVDSKISNFKLPTNWESPQQRFSGLVDKSTDATYNKVMILDSDGKAGTKNAGDLGKVKTVNGQEPNENGDILLDYIPLTGTKEGKPIKGTLGMKGSFGHVFIRNEGDSAATLYSHYSTDPTIGSSHLSFMHNSMLFVDTYTENGVEKESSFTVSPTGFEYTNTEDGRPKSTFIANSRKFKTSYSDALNRRFFEIGEDGFIHRQTHNDSFGTLESEIKNDKKGYKVLSKYTDQYESVRDFSQIHTDTEFNTQVKSIYPIGDSESTILEQTITDFRIWTENKTSSTVTKIPYTPTEEASISTKGYVDAMQTKPTNWTNANQRFSGLVDKSADATYNALMGLDSGGNAGKLTALGNVLESGLQTISSAQALRIGQLLNGGRGSSGTLSVNLISPPIIQNRFDSVEYVLLRGSNLYLDNTNYAIEILDESKTNVVATIPQNQVQLYADGTQLIFYYNFYQFLEGRYFIRLTSGSKVLITTLDLTIIQQVEDINTEAITWEALYNESITPSPDDVLQGSNVIITTPIGVSSVPKIAIKSSQIFAQGEDFYLEMSINLGSKNLVGSDANRSYIGVGYSNINNTLVNNTLVNFNYSWGYNSNIAIKNNTTKVGSYSSPYDETIVLIKTGNLFRMIVGNTNYSTTLSNNSGYSVFMSFVGRGINQTITTKIIKAFKFN